MNIYEVEFMEYTNGRYGIRKLINIFQLIEKVLLQKNPILII